jgi:uncharacterized protein (DUF4415 family)
MPKRKSEWNDNPEWTVDAIKSARPVREAHPALAEWSEKRMRGQRGPQRAPVKVPVNLRVDPDVLSAYKATGAGWQTRMTEVLRRYGPKPKVMTAGGTLNTD